MSRMLDTNYKVAGKEFCRIRCALKLLGEHETG